MTRSFSSDSIEYLFSALRQRGGRYDQMNQVSAMYALDKINKVGIISGSLSSNVGERENVTQMLNVNKNWTESSHSKKLNGSAFLDIELKVLEDPPVT